MKKIIATFDHVVVPGELQQTQSSNSHQRERGEKNGEKHPPTTTKTAESKKPTKKKSGKKGKDEQSGETIAKRAEMQAEDPYMTDFDKQGGEGGSKEKEKKADEGEESEGGEEKSPDETRREEAVEAKKDLDILVSRADKILFKADGIFPFDFFPDTVTIDANKVDIIIRTFFATETATSVQIKEIMDVRVESSLFFGKLLIDYGPHPLKVSTVYIPTLRKKDALRAKEILEGMLIVYRGENIDTTRLKPEDTIDEIKQIGKIEERE